MGRISDMHLNLAGDLVTPASEDARKPLGDKATIEAFSESCPVALASEDTSAKPDWEP